MNNSYSAILIILIILFYLDIINVELFKSNPILFIFLILNIIVIYKNKTIGYILLLLFIFNVINLKKKMKGGGFLKSTITSILPIASVIDEFKNFTDNNSKKSVETYVETTTSPKQPQETKEKVSDETTEESTTEESTTEDSSEDELIDSDDSYDPYDDLDIDEDEEMEFNLKDLLL